MILLEDLKVYQLAMEIGELVFNITVNWDLFNKKSLGDQYLRAADSIALNISEGYGRFHFKENKNFCWYARGSLFETKTANQKAFDRKLITDEGYNNLLNKLKECHLLLNGYIKSIGKSNPGENDQ
ncbi:MAG: four helix bundle protein [Bacteroidetes bacterium]|nr:four helix bundle protein [Bacteroidota bacterium]